LQHCPSPGVLVRRDGGRVIWSTRDRGGSMGRMHLLELDERTLHGDFSVDREPVLTGEPGDSVRLRTVESGWSTQLFTGADADYRHRPRHPAYRESFGHALVGPIAVRGARPGATLAVRITDVVPGGWGHCLGGGSPTVFNKRYGAESDG